MPHSFIDSYDEIAHGDTLVRPHYFLHPAEARHYQFRCAPVPGIGRPPLGHSFRHPRTRAAHRAAQTFRLMIREGEIPEDRGISKLARLPTAWDDIQRPYINRSWKSYRRAQRRGS
jgi:hypothetical protein